MSRSGVRFSSRAPALPLRSRRRSSPWSPAESRRQRRGQRSRSPRTAAVDRSAISRAMLRRRVRQSQGAVHVDNERGSCPDRASGQDLRRGRLGGAVVGLDLRRDRPGHRGALLPGRGGAGAGRGPGRRGGPHRVRRRPVAAPDPRPARRVPAGVRRWPQRPRRRPRQIWPHQSGVLHRIAKWSGMGAAGTFSIYAAMADTFPFEEPATPTRRRDLRPAGAGAGRGRRRDRPVERTDRPDREQGRPSAHRRVHRRPEGVARGARRGLRRRRDRRVHRPAARCAQRAHRRP